MKKTAFAFFVAAIVSCNTNPASENESTLSQSDSLLTEVLAGHDVAMPKMIKLERLRKEAKTELDSLKKLPGNHKERMALLDSTIKNLSYADVVMHEWMEGFKYDSLKNDETQRQAYLRIQLASVNEMKDIVLSSIQKADSVLAR